eukprot:TRINITY_DN63383_c0_g1_i1.p1 TRINITY_DN63383_c0_g1~~TRINITY_DN63383_c0_g1_i1.p1  ORF type:complete len:691 (-),score=84.94 TRINITY_DN63383_c0_g1_i1:43-2115(-)
MPQVAAAVPIGTPQRCISRGVSASPSRASLEEWASPRAGSPSAIISEAKEFVAACSPQLHRVRRPSLDGLQQPFGDSESPEGPRSNTGLGPPRRLPSLTMEAFSAMKRRDGIESRCSDPGVTSRDSSGARDSSRTLRKSRRRQAERGSCGANSAPVSRGVDQVSYSPLNVPEPPMTEPYHQGAVHLSRCQSDQFPLETHGLTTPRSNMSTVSSRRPPQVPPSTSSAYGTVGTHGSSSSRHNSSRGPSTTGYSTAARLESVLLPQSTGGFCPQSETKPRVEGLCGLARSPEKAPDLPPGPSPLHLTQDEAVGTVASDGLKKSTKQSTATTAATTAASRLELPVHEGWDGDEESSFSYPKSGAASRLPSKLSVSRGPHGITALSLGGAAGASTSDSFTTPRQKESSGNYEGTMSSPDAIRGSRFTWVRGQVLGHGSLGSVYEGLDQSNGQIFAVKEVRIDRRLDTDVKLQRDLENEVDIYKDLKHPHIVAYFGHDYIHSHLYIYLEYMPGGSVAQVLSQFGPFAEELIKRYARDLLEGLEYLHTRQPVVLHRDIKGANILVGDGGVKLADFGCSKRTQDTLAQSLRGSVPWMAPEVIQQTGYGRRSDIWSFGCVIIEMATARHPWGHFDNPMAAMMRIGMSQETPPVPESVSEVCQDFIVKCTVRDRTVRPLASALLNHDFVQDVRDMSISE